MNKVTLSTLLFVVLLGGGVALIGALQDRTLNNVPAPLGQQAQEQGISVVLEVPEVRYSITLSKGSSVYDLLVKAQEETEFRFSGKDFIGLGFFVEEINGKEQNPRAGKYWIYYINDQKAEVGISIYKLKSHDVISWKYEDEE